MNLSGSSKKGVDVFSRVVIFLSKICPPHTQFVWHYLYIYACHVILYCPFCHAHAYAITANDASLHLLVPPYAQYYFFGASCTCVCGLLEHPTIFSFYVFDMPCRRKLLHAVHMFIHLNLAISLLLGYLIFMIGIETATSSTVSIEQIM